MASNDPTTTPAELAGAKGEQQPAEYVPSPDIAAIAERLCARHATLNGLRNARIAYLLLTNTKPEQGQAREASIDTIAKAVKAPPLWLALSEYHAAIVVNDMAWQLLGPRQREAVVMHELLHLEWDDEKERVVVLKHDVEEFSMVAREYGPWHGGLERFHEQLELFEEQRRHRNS